MLSQDRGGGASRCPHHHFVKTARIRRSAAGNRTVFISPLYSTPPHPSAQQGSPLAGTSVLCAAAAGGQAAGTALLPSQRGAPALRSGPHCGG